jgi:hypothetical protein
LLACIPGSRNDLVQPANQASQETCNE